MAKSHQLATVIPDVFTEGRWLLCRESKWAMRTVVSDHCDKVSAERERRLLQAHFDFDFTVKSDDPFEPRQLVLGFYGPEQGDA